MFAFFMTYVQQHVADFHSIFAGITGNVLNKILLKLAAVASRL